MLFLSESQSLSKTQLLIKFLEYKDTSWAQQAKKVKDS